MADLGPETGVKVGDEVVLLGKSGDEEITGDEWARLLGTIPYEVTCQINARVPRIYRLISKNSKTRERAPPAF